MHRNSWFSEGWTILSKTIVLSWQDYSSIILMQLKLCNKWVLTKTVNSRFGHLENNLGTYWLQGYKNSSQYRKPLRNKYFTIEQKNVCDVFFSGLIMWNVPTLLNSKFARKQESTHQNLIAEEKFLINNLFLHVQKSKHDSSVKKNVNKEWIIKCDANCI